IEDLLAVLAIVAIGGQKDHADAVFTVGWQLKAEPVAFLFQKPVRHLEEDTGAVARILLATAGAAMLQVQEHLDRFLKHVARLAPHSAEHEADTAGVVRVAGVVKTRLFRSGLVGIGSRRVHPAFFEAGAAAGERRGFSPPVLLRGRRDFKRTDCLPWPWGAEP